MADSALDPTDDDTAAPGDNSSSDASKSGFQKAWEAWQSRPENNAALLQFGISMLQPHAAGQSGLGAAANAVGEAGQAAGRYIATQNLEEDRASTQADKVAQRENQATTAGSGRITANAYADSVKNAANKVGGLSGTLKVQGDFNRWLAKPEDPLMGGDPVVGAISKQFPDVKTKADLLANPAARAAAFALFKASIAAPEDTSGGDGSVPAPPSAPAPAARTIYDKKGKAYSWDGVNPPVPQ